MGSPVGVGWWWERSVPLACLSEYNHNARKPTSPLVPVGNEATKTKKRKRKKKKWRK